MMQKPAETQYPIHPLLANRWSPRAFSSRPVEAEKLLRLFEAARWAPSSMNLQPWSFIVAAADDSETHDRMAQVLNARNQEWARSAPVLLLAVAQRERQPGTPNRFAWYDLGQAVALLSTQATADGLALHQMGGFDSEKARQAFAIPEGYEAVTAIALGYHGSLDALPEDQQVRERAPRQRKPLEAFVFAGQWGQPLAAEAETASIG